MVAAPEYAVFKFVGQRSGKTYSVDAYYSDVAAGLVNWDAGDGASATSPTEWTAPEPVILVDVAIVTGGTDTKKFQLTRNGRPSGDFLRHTLHLASLANRSPLRIGLPAGASLRALQRA